MTLCNSLFLFCFSFQKEETLTHIIHELRNYKKSLEEKIVAGRRCSSSQDAKDSNNVTRAIQQHKSTNNNQASRANNWSTPTSTTGNQQRRIVAPPAADDCGRTARPSLDGRKADCWPLKSITRTDGSSAADEKQQLPDLVRSHNPSTVTATSSHAAGGQSAAMTPKTYSLYATHPLSPACLSSTCHYGPQQARYVVDPQNGTKYECDEFGAIDLRVGKKTAGVSLPFYVACSRGAATGKMNVDCGGGDSDDGEKVLDLSVSSKVKVDKVKLAMTEERVPKRKRLSDGHSRRAVKKQTWPASAGKMLAWSVVDVVKFVNEVPGCTVYAEVSVFVILFLLSACLILCIVEDKLWG